MGGIDFRFGSYKGVVDYYNLVLLGFARFANALASRHLEPPRFLWVTPDVADWTI